MLKDLWKVLTGYLSSGKLEWQAGVIRSYVDQVREVDDLKEKNLRLVQQLRQMDQLIFNMAQKATWEEMRPIFQDITALVNRRMQVENNRIRTLMVEEVKKAYNE